MSKKQFLKEKSRELIVNKIEPLIFIFHTITAYNAYSVYFILFNFLYNVYLININYFSVSKIK